MDIVLTDEIKLRSVLNYGNPYRLIELFNKARRGEKITFVSLGGSITQRYNASSYELCYASLVAEWLKATFPQTEIDFVNAGIGATGSLIALHRLERDVLRYNPDFVIIEFSVNEGNTELAKNTYDNLIYNILNSKTNPAVLLLCMMNIEGNSAQDTHSKVGIHYDLPIISYRDAMLPEIKNKQITWRDLSDDNIHPHDSGHKITAELITAYLDSLLKKELTDFGEPNYPDLLTKYRFSTPEIFYVDDIKPFNIGCFSRENVNLNKIPFGWVAHENGAPLEFKFEGCRRVYFLIQKTNRGDGGKAIVNANGRKTALDCDFKDGWGVYYNCELIFSSEEKQDVLISIQPELENGRHFALAGIMVSY